MRSEEFLRELHQKFPHPSTLEIKQSALLVVDMQEYFRPLATEILPRLMEIIAACRRKGVPVIYTQHSHKDPSTDGGMLAQWWDQLIIAGSSEAQLMPEIAPLPGDKVVAKNRYSAFYMTDLEDYLRKRGVTDLLIGGVMTNLCCETTARDAFVRDYRVFFLADGTATSTEDFHRATLANLAFGFAYLVTCQQMVQRLEKA